MITRFFHPVGQGAFYSERHEGYNIVYDCGELHNRKAAKVVVKQAFDRDVIDILFISHLDYDHISLIDTLKDNNTIKTVILPLTKLDDKKLSIASCIRGEKTISDSLVTLISSPQEYFGDGTKVIQIRPNNEDLSFEKVHDPISIEQCDGYMSSGTPIYINCFNNSCPNDDNWCFIPYNFDFSSRVTAFKSNVSNKGLDYDSLDDLTYIKGHLDDIKKCYEGLPGGTNGNSMLVYSGPISEGHELGRHYLRNCWCNPHFFIVHHPRMKPACIYTGDVNLNDVDLNKLLPPRYEQFVGTIQVPHHGSMLSFNNTNFYNRPIIAPISYGNSNTFGHPSAKVLDSLLRSRHIPVSITNDLGSLYIQTIL